MELEQLGFRLFSKNTLAVISFVTEAIGRMLLGERLSSTLL
ncbi:DacC protein [[Mannheimia] succiniciproducens MBEL55E]|uniref:DacC protein n=1 Tax=Mannheimia succiniciproducens (strain KCTC 0769BP / MBEL55E) TaxID=221988 RepID=Q65UA3_MANSM|nr:DacC protein [[Mannheimia] succiniciproducens MBEL55E]